MHDREILVSHTWPTRPAWLARTDVLVFSAGTAVLGLHAIVDSFIAPETGTAQSDHLLRGAATVTVAGFQAGPRAYEERVTRFFDRAPREPR